MRSKIGVIIAACVPLLLAGRSHAANQLTNAENWAILVPPAVPASSWQLETNQVPALILGAKAYLERTLSTTTNNPDQGSIPAILSKWDSYSCQLWPAVEGPDKRKVAVLSFFPSSEKTNWHKDWRSGRVTVKGGGNSYWTASYDPEKREFFRLAVNGPL